MEDIKNVLSRYKSGLHTEKDLELIEEMLSNETLSMTDIEEVNDLSQAMTHQLVQGMLDRMDQRFYSQIDLLKHNEKKVTSNKWILLLSGALLLLTAFTFYLLGSLHSQEERAATPSLSPQHFASTLLSKDQVADRIHLISNIPKQRQLDDNSLDVLLYSLISDESINVRLACLNSLKLYSDNPFVRQGLINAITFQDSPIVLMYIREALSMTEESLSEDEFTAKINQNTKQAFGQSLKSISL